MTRMTRMIRMAAVAIAAAGLMAANLEDPPLRGYTAESSRLQREWEAKFRAIPSAERVRENLRTLSSRPNHLGSAHQKQNAEWLRDRGLFQLERDQYENAHRIIVEHYGRKDVRLVTPLLGIGDVRSDKRIDFVGGARGTAELEKLVDTGKHIVAFSMFPVSVDDLMVISDAGGIMPPKSTWFEPKLRDGLLSHLI